MTEDLSEQQLAEATLAAVQLSQVRQPMIFEASAYDCYLLAGLLQMSLKFHADLPVGVRAYAVGMVETIRMWFEAMDCPEVVRQIDTGPRS